MRHPVAPVVLGTRDIEKGHLSLVTRRAHHNETAFAMANPSETAQLQRVANDPCQMIRDNNTELSYA